MNQTVAILAPIFNSIALIPQLYRTWTTKSVEDLSLYTLCLFIITTCLWLAHGIYIDDPSLIISGFINLTVNLTLLGLYWKYV